MFGHSTLRIVKPTSFVIGSDNDQGILIGILAKFQASVIAVVKEILSGMTPYNNHLHGRTSILQLRSLDKRHLSLF